MKKIIVLLLVCISQFVLAQKQGNIWYFGENAGLDFNTVPPTTLTNGALNTLEGCASIADPITGKLLFYSDGITVWNKNHVAMASTVITPLIGDPSATQSAVIVGKPGSTNLYYIFSIPRVVESTIKNPNASMCYSIVDMNLNGGLGEITVRNVPLMDFATEKIAAVGNCAGSSYWIVGHKWDCDSFYAYELTAAGLSAPVKSKVGIVHTGNISSSIGYMKFSSNGNKIGLCTYTLLNTMQIFDFNSATGIVSNPITEVFNFSGNGDGIYGCTFSPDCSKFYVSTLENGTDSRIFQYNMQAGNNTAILASKVLVGKSVDRFGALQNAPNNKLYIAKAGATTLDEISNPNNIGTNCNFIANAVNLNGKISTFGLPCIVESYLTPPLKKFQVPQQIGPIPNKIISCNNNSLQFVQNVKTVFSIQPTGTYTINADSSIVTFNPTVNTTYTVITLGECGSNDTSTFTITIGTSPVANFYVTPNPPTKSTELISLSNASINAVSYKWYLNDSLVSTNTDFAYSNPKLGTTCYKLVTTGAQGCVDSAIKCVQINDTFETVIFLPNAFTPNNDVVNNEFKVQGKNFTLQYLTVYNRYGQQLFTTTNSTVGWDGYQNGLPCDAGTYYYKLKYTDYKKVVFESSGDILLIK